MPFIPSAAQISANVQAADVSIADTGNYFTGTDVEDALQELGADLAAPGVENLFTYYFGR